MATISSQKLNQVKEWYIAGDSMREIGEKLGASLNSVIYFFRKHDISRRSPKEANKVLFDKKPLSFLIKDKLTAEEKRLKIAGLMLYWAEGTERNSSVDFVNSNTAMILLFLKFLRVICRVDERRLRVFIYCYDDQDRDQLISYWSKKTEISACQFTKPYVRKKSNMRFGRRMEYGLVHIRYSDIKLLRYLIEEKDEYLACNKIK